MKPDTTDANETKDLQGHLFAEFGRRAPDESAALRRELDVAMIRHGMERVNPMASDSAEDAEAPRSANWLFLKGRRQAAELYPKHADRLGSNGPRFRDLLATVEDFGGLFPWTVTEDDGREGTEHPRSENPTTPVGKSDDPGRKIRRPHMPDIERLTVQVKQMYELMSRMYDHRCEVEKVFGELEDKHGEALKELIGESKYNHFIEWDGEERDWKNASICPDCASSESAQSYESDHCPPNMSFADWVRDVVRKNWLRDVPTDDPLYAYYCEPNPNVLCDACGEDWTHRSESGGLVIL